jgi:hypothetical protein
MMLDRTNMMLCQAWIRPRKNRSRLERCGSGGTNTVPDFSVHGPSAHTSRRERYGLRISAYATSCKVDLFSRTAIIPLKPSPTTFCSCHFFPSAYRTYFLMGTQSRSRCRGVSVRLQRQRAQPPPRCFCHGTRSDSDSRTSSCTSRTHLFCYNPVPASYLITTAFLERSLSSSLSVLFGFMSPKMHPMASVESPERVPFRRQCAPIIVIRLT